MENSKSKNTTAGYAALAKSEKSPVAGAQRTGDVDAAEKVSVSILVRPKAQMPAPLADTASAQIPHLTREAFADRYGAAQADLDQVTAFAKANGLKVGEVSQGRRTIVLSGTAAQMNTAFGVTLGQYQADGFTYRGREGDIHVPGALTQIIESIHGLDNRPVAEPLVRVKEPDALQPNTVSGTTPAQVAKLYNFPTVSAAGQTIAIIELGGGFKPADIANYFNNVVHLPVPAITVVSVDGGTNSPGVNANADMEVVLDIDVVGAAAPGAKIVVYFAPNTFQGFQDAVSVAIHDAVNKPSVISISWGALESAFGASITTFSNVIDEAAMLGVTIFVASGDSGSYTPAKVQFPASAPGVVSCGGTTLNITGNTFTETVWNNSFGATGGGISSVFARPLWQNWANIPVSVNPAGHVGRGVPDVAGNADPASGYKLIINGAATGTVGGTSAVAPLYAALTALLNATTGEPAGFLNINMYAFQGPYVYRDITVGNNGAYHATAGWDACTGLGSINGLNMANSLWGVALPPALAVFNNKLMMAWKGIERDDRIFTNSFNGLSWTAQQQVANTGTSTGVSMAVFNNQVYMAWKGQGADQGIYFSHYNGVTWAAQQLVVGIGSSTGPRLAVFNNQLYMIWKGVEGDQRIFWNFYNGATWTAQQAIAGVATSVGPDIEVFNGKLYAAWKGMNGDQGIYYSSFNGAAWAAQQVIPGVASSNGPSLAVYNGKLFAAWKGMLTDQRLFWSSFNGTTWAAQQQIPGVASSVGPNLCVFGTNLYAAWKGMLGDQGIYYSQYNGLTWAAQHNIPGIGTSGDLVAHIQTAASMQGAAM